MALVEYVASHPECGVRQIAEGLGLSPPTVSVGIKHLEETGVIERKVHPLDKRALQLSLTADGRELHQQMLGFRRQMLSKLLSGLSPQETVQLLDLLEKALDHAEFSDAESIETGDIE
jgi:DNA-binding MarR family transcriptional regulator